MTMNSIFLHRLLLSHNIFHRSGIMSLLRWRKLMPSSVCSSTISAGMSVSRYFYQDVNIITIYILDQYTSNEVDEKFNR